jgi:hypothetical protein
LVPLETVRDILVRIDANRAIKAFLPLDVERVREAVHAVDLALPFPVLSLVLPPAQKE